MKIGIVTHTKSHNYGDDIQSLAAKRLIENLGFKVDYLLEREYLNNVDIQERIKLITNGWYMENPNNWPPSKNILPLFISFHITHNNNAAKLMISKKYYNYYKQFEPIGCRDYHTVKLFKNIGIDAYYSGCLTLTLENKSKLEEKTEEIIFVDAFNKNLPKDLREKMFKKLVPDSIKNNIVKIDHSHNSDNNDIKQRLEFAEQLLNRYSKAHLVVTSRIHVALPCIALGTPVLFTDVGFNLRTSRNRFNGVVEYFNKLTNDYFPYTGIDPISLLFRKFHLYNYYYDNSKIDFNWENPPKNPVDITPVSNKIKETVRLFLEN